MQSLQTAHKARPLSQSRRHPATKAKLRFHRRQQMSSTMCGCAMSLRTICEVRNTAGTDICRYSWLYAIDACCHDCAGRQASKWPDESRPYLRFCLHKENRDSMAAVSMLSRFTDSPFKHFSFAGTKDKRAV